MHEQSAIPIERLRACLQEQYGLVSITLDFLPLGLDYNAGVYRVESLDNGNRAFYLLKVKAGILYEAGCLVPDYLRKQGITAVVAPLPTLNNTLWTRIDNWTVLVYPFIEGDTSWSGMTDEQWKEVGIIFKRIHLVPLPSFGFESLRKETFDPTGYSRWIQNFGTQHVLHEEVDKNVPNAQHALLLSWRMHQSTIDRVVTYLEKLGDVLQKCNLPYVICHADLHPANLLRDLDNHLHVIDWDEVMLAPKERDFIFVDVTINDGSTTYSLSPFFQGYGQTNIDWIALTYYRYERVVQDLIECTRQVFLKDDISEEARADAAQLFNEVLAEDGEIAAAHKAAAQLPEELIRN